MKESEKTFQILDALDSQNISTQRQLAEHSDISLGRVNYILKSLLALGTLYREMGEYVPAASFLEQVLDIFC